MRADSRGRKAVRITPPEPPATSAVAGRPPALETGEVVEDLRLRDADLADASAAGVRMERVVMEGGSLARASLPRAVVLDARFAGCDLAGSRWERAHLGRVEMDGCRLVGAGFARATLADVRLREANGEMAIFISATFTATRFERCNLRGASFEGADLRGAVFRGCDLRNADLRGCKLHGTDLRGSTLAGVSLGTGALRGLVLDPSQALEVVEQLGADVRPLEEGEE